MLVSDIARRVRDSAGDTNVIQFSNATLTDWINDAVLEIAVEQSSLQAIANTPTVVGQSDYTLPTDIYKLHSVRWGGRKLDIITLEQWEASNAGDFTDPAPNSSPMQCWVYAGVLTVFPPPDQVKNLVISYTKLPQAITYADPNWTPTSPPINSSFHNRIVDYCLAQVALQDEDNYKYNMLMMQFRTGIQQNDQNKNEDDLYPFISVSPRDQGDMYTGEYYG